MKLFGFEIIRKDDNSASTQTFTLPGVADDVGNAGIVGVQAFSGNLYSNNQSTAIEVTENNHIQQCREIAGYHEVDDAIEEIISEAIITVENMDSIKLDLSNTQFPDPIKDKIRKSFKKIYNILDFKTKGHGIFRRWYIDGRLNYHIVVDEKNMKSGIQELRYIDPKKIRRVRQFIGSTPDNTLIGKIDEYYIYNASGINDALMTDVQGVRVSKDSIAYAHSGLTDSNNRYIVSFLNKAIANANKLRTLENSMVIYRLVRAPERRIFYIDVANLPKARAEQYLQGIMQKYKTKLTYDSVTGKIRDDRSVMSMTEDYFIPRRDGAKSTEITTLQGQSMNGGVDELEYFKKQLLQSLNVPLARMDSSSSFNVGNSGEITKEESNFSKFITRLQTQFSILFDELMEKELILTQVMSIEEWEYERKNIHYEFLKDNYFVELQQSDMFASRLGLLGQAEPFIGTYFSKEYVFKNILKMTDEEIEIEKQRIAKEKEDNPDVHEPTEVTHQVNLQHQLASIEVDKENSMIGKDEPNPFREDFGTHTNSDSNKLDEAITQMILDMRLSKNIITSVDDITK